MDNPLRHPLAQGVTRIVLPGRLGLIRMAWQDGVPRWPLIHRLAQRGAPRPERDRY